MTINVVNEVGLKPLPKCFLIIIDTSKKQNKTLQEMSLQIDVSSLDHQHQLKTCEEQHATNGWAKKAAQSCTMKDKKKKYSNFFLNIICILIAL